MATPNDKPKDLHTASRGRMPRYGAWLGLALSLLAFLVTADVWVVDGAQRNEHGYRTQILEGRVVDLDRVPAQPGDVVRIWPERVVPRDPLRDYEMWVLEGGTSGPVFETGSSPSGALYHVAGMQTGVDQAQGALTFTRPAPPAGQPGTHLDIVWIYRFEPGAAPAEGTEARTYFDRLVETQVAGSDRNTVVLQAWAVIFHRVATALVAVMAIASVVLAVLWIPSLLRRPIGPARDEPIASLVSLVQFAGGFLGQMRALLIGLAFPLVLLGWLSLAVVGNYPSGLVGPAGWQTVLDVGLAVLLVVLALAWAVSAWTVTGAYRRWRRAAAESPWTE